MDAGTLITSLSLLIQIVSFVFAVRMMRHAGRRPIAAVLLSVVFLMALRRGVDLVHGIRLAVYRVDVPAQFISLIISSLLLLCVLFITRVIVSEKKTAEAAAEAMARYRALFNQSPDGVVLFDADSSITEFNDRACRQLGYTREEFTGLQLKDIAPLEGAAEVRDQFEQVSREGRAEFEVKHRTKDGEMRDVRILAQTFNLSGRLFHHAIWRDITEQRRMADELDHYRRMLEESVMHRTQELQVTIDRLAREINERVVIEEDLKQNRLFLNNILNSIQDPIMVLDKNLRVLMVNNTFGTMFLGGRVVGFSEDFCHRIFYGISQPCPDCLSKSVLSTGAIAHRTVSHGEEGSARRWYDICAFPLATPEGRVIGSVHHMCDITGRKTAEERIIRYQERLRLFAYQLIRTEERERRRIAQALHDGFPQKLALSKMLLQKMQSGLPSGDSTGGIFTRLYELFDGMAKEVRSLTFQLAPPVLYEVGLEPALERLLTNMLTGTEIRWTFENWRVGLPLRGELATVLYAMVRELVMNVIKYAEARSVKVTVAQCDDLLLAVVQDDGKGMPAGTERQKVRDRHGFGLFSLRERLRHLNGRLGIESGVGKGTTVRIEIPSGSADILAAADRVRSA